MTRWTVCWLLSAAIGLHGEGVGVFGQGADIGGPGLAGASRYERGEYRLTASGHNLWGTADGFHFVWQAVRGDVAITAAVEWVGEGKNAHRKAGPMIRAGAEADAAYADFVVHGNGELAMQYRKVRGGPTAEVKTGMRGAVKARLARHGDVFSVEVARRGGAWQMVGALSIAMPETALVGLAACAHDNTVVETAVVREVDVEVTGVVEKRRVESTLEVLDLESGERRTVRRAVEHFEAPNWSRDGGSLIYNSGGRLYRIAVGGGEPVAVDTGERVRCNNDHGLSPDGKWLAISDSSANRQSQIYVLPSGGGTPRLVTPEGPSYWHGWSPDGKTLAYCARRNGEFDVYTVGVDGGEERRLTTAAGLDDGPDYSPDGAWIYFNSVRSGVMRIWRMRADGSEQEMVVAGADSADWFAHPSPDGKRMVYLSFDKGVEGHPANKDVVLKVAGMNGESPRVVATLFGGQGTINVPSWSPDGRQFAFVSYRLVK